MTETMTTALLVEMLREELRPLHAAAADRLESLETEVARLKAEIGRVAVFLAIHGVEGYTIMNEANHD
jgi:hypothetical protein